MSPIAFFFANNSLQTVSLGANKIVLALFALELGASPLIIGLLTALFSLAAVTLAVPMGRLTDRVGARWLLVAGSVGAGCGLLLPWFFPSLPAVLIAGALAGLSLACFNVTTQNLVGLFSTPETRARNFSNYALTMAAGQLLGPLAGGFLTDHAGHRLACLILGLYGFAPLLLLAMRRGPLEQGALHRPAPAKPTAGHGGGTLALFGDRNIRSTIITASFLVSGIGLMQAYLPVYAHSVGLSASVIGIVVSMSAVASFVTRAVLPRLIALFKEQKVMALSFCFGGTALALVPFFQHPVMLGALAFLFGLGMGAAQPVVSMLIFQFSPPGRSAEAIGLKITTNHLTNMVSPLAFGAFAVAAGLASMFWLNAAMMALGCWISWPRKRTRH